MTWIKICGMTTAEAVAAAVQMRVNAIGFVFAPSSRQISIAAAQLLAAPARGRVLCFAVTQHPTQDAIDQIVAEFRPDVLQTDQADLPRLRLPETLEVLPVIRGLPTAGTALPARLLFEGLASGSGRVCDWTGARGVASRAELILAGGLNATNVIAAITAVRPFGVDVSSGVESSPGRKNPAEMARFVAAVRCAPLGQPIEERA